MDRLVGSYSELCLRQKTDVSQNFALVEITCFIVQNTFSFRLYRSFVCEKGSFLHAQLQYLGSYMHNYSI